MLEEILFISRNQIYYPTELNQKAKVDKMRDPILYTKIYIYISQNK